MELGTIIITCTTPAKSTGQSPRTAGGRSSPPYSNCPVAYWDLLGQSILQRTVARLRQSGVRLVTVVNKESNKSTESKTEGWERAFFEYVRTGVDRVMLISLGAYTEFEVEEVVRFHGEKQCPVTNVSDEDGPLGITLIESKRVDHDFAQFRSRLSAFASCSSTYEFSGYVNRLVAASDYRQLVQHALIGIADARPIGREVKPGVWVADGARISPSARILGPSYIGAHTKIRAGALIAGNTAVEQHCDVDCGTVVESSSILPRTYLGPGLHVSQSVVNGSRLIHLGRNLDVELGATGLIGRTGPSAPLRVLDRLSSVFGNFRTESGSGLSTPSSAPASVEWVRGDSSFS